ncbi:MAG: hypothetical protein C7B46_08285 [Sulfobacillus benefaciens]|uniref:Uncharacterized protein n=1 Tax=Sulfobacillus benefaciens TaxID=453960 RepID=A0A2T2XH54_9FIRM|nr:MAG: hypothetical protein C7B46_08285 [Sulfobacillus benefaciens]
MLTADWFDYLEEATATIASNQEARQVRQELLSHLESLAWDLQQEGWSEAQAPAEALRRLGDAQLLAQAFRESRSNDQRFAWGWWAAAWTVLALSAIGVVGSLEFLIPATVAVLFLAIFYFGPQPSWTQWVTVIRHTFLTHWRLFVAGGVVGAIWGLKPWWPGSVHLIPQRVSLGALGLGFAVTLWALIAEWRHARHGTGRWSPGLSALGLGMTASIVGCGLGHAWYALWPHPMNWRLNWYPVSWGHLMGLVMDVYTAIVFVGSSIMAFLIKLWPQAPAVPERVEE